jgi:hypothetical protein
VNRNHSYDFRIYNYIASDVVGKRKKKYLLSKHAGLHIELQIFYNAGVVKLAIAGFYFCYYRDLDLGPML